MTAPVDFSGFVDELATVSGRVILPFFRTSLAVVDKTHGTGTFDPVTEADRAAEVAMRRRITETFPNHGIVGEEFGTERGDAEFVWVLDPIDGTRAFMSGLPLWGTLIGLTRSGRAAYGMMHQPFIGERFFGDCGVAGYRGPHGARAIRTRRCDGLGAATLSTTSPTLFKGEGELDAYRQVEAEVRLVRYGYDCYAYCMLSAGHLDLVIEAGLKPYDVVALVPIVEGAGGVITTWTGGRPEDGGAIVASGDPRLHEAVLKRLSG